MKLLRCHKWMEIQSLVVLGSLDLEFQVLGSLDLE